MNSQFYNKNLCLFRKFSNTHVIYRATLRENNCLPILLQQLKSPSLTVVSNACGTLWNLSARCHQDQRTLWELGAVPMLRSLVHSKHKMISMGSSAALKNLLAARPDADIMDRVSRGELVRFHIL